MKNAETRFGGMGRLYGTAGMRRLRAAHVCVVGIGGVGSWVVEALARSGIGSLTLLDLDEVCISNVNRQIHALAETIGQSKVAVMADRVRSINPECRVTAVLDFFTEVSAHRLVHAWAESGTEPGRESGANAVDGTVPHGEEMDRGSRSTWVVDAIDSVANKCRLITLCRARGLPIISCGGAGGRRDPTRVRISDLGTVTHDRLLAEVRRRLRRHHGFPRDGLEFGVPSVHSPEPPVYPRKDGSVCDSREPLNDGASLRLNCDWGFGSASFVTGAFGLAAAGWIVGRIVTP